MMHKIKMLLVGFGGLFLLLTAVTSLIPSKVRVTRQVVIGSKEEGPTREQVQHLYHWRHWHPFFQSALVTDVQFHDSVDIRRQSLQFSYHGKITRIQAVDTLNNGFQCTLTTEGERPIDCDIHIAQLPSLQSIQVTWTAMHHLHWYPWEKIYGVFLDRLAGPGYDAALLGLQARMEKH